MKFSGQSLIVTAMFFALLAPAAYPEKLNTQDLAKKKEGWYPTGIPLVNFSSDDGFGYGFRIYIYDNGSRGDTYFDSAPYFLQMYAQYFATASGIQSHELNLDMPYILATKFRVKTAFVFDKDLNANYFGTGEQQSQKKLTDHTGREYDSYDNYEESLDADKAYYKWYKYTIIRPRYDISVFRDLTDRIRLMAGAEFKKVTVETWRDRNFDNVTQAGTLLDRDREYLSSRAGGSLGGWVNYARLGIGYDTRDFEPDPNRGIYLDYCIEGAGGATGSDFSFTKNTAGANFYVDPVTDLVLAFRAAYTTAAGRVPFHEMNWFGFSQNRRNGLGGNRTLRGYKKDRFVGKTMTLANAEARWQFHEAVGAGQRFGFQLIGFVDAGNVYDEAADPAQDPDWGDYRFSYGGGFVVAWNLSTIIHLYYGISREDTGIFLNFEHNF